MLWDNRGQTLLEYIMIIGVVLIVLFAVVMLFNSIQNQYKKDAGKIDAIP